MWPLSERKCSNMRCSSETWNAKCMRCVQSDFTVDTLTMHYFLLFCHWNRSTYRKSHWNVYEYLEVNYYSHSWLFLNLKKTTSNPRDSFLFMNYSMLEIFVFIGRNSLLVESFSSTFVWSIPLCWFKKGTENLIFIQIEWWIQANLLFFPSTNVSIWSDAVGSFNLFSTFSHSLSDGCWTQTAISRLILLSTYLFADAKWMAEVINESQIDKKCLLNKWIMNDA